jgi:hypothetical protein
MHSASREFLRLYAAPPEAPALGCRCAGKDRRDGFGIATLLWVEHFGEVDQGRHEAFAYASTNGAAITAEVTWVLASRPGKRSLPGL